MTKNHREAILTL